jgi:S-DNA-T family DNA segregation ATPase FtsK/SpoIIIE
MAGVPGDLVGGRRPPGRAVWLPATTDAGTDGRTGDGGGTVADHGHGGAALCQVALDEPSTSAGATSTRPSGTVHVGPEAPAGDARSGRPRVTVRLRPVPHHVTVADLTPASGPGCADPTAVPVGLGGDDAGPVRVRFDRGALVAGPPGSGRSSALAVVVRGLLAGGHRPLVVARDGPLRDLGARHLPDLTCGFALREIDDAIDALLRPPADARPVLVVVDDLDVLEQSDPAASLRLTALAGVNAAAAGPVRLVASARTAAVCMSFRGALGGLRTVRRGVVLSPQEPGSSEVFGVDLSWDTDPARPHDPGRGVVVDERRTAPVQVATLDTGRDEVGGDGPASAPGALRGHGHH